MSAFAITNGVSQLPAGWMADRIGTRFVILISITGVALAGFFIGFTNSYTMLVALLIVSALLGGGYHPASAAALSASVPEEYRGRALGVHFIGGSSTMWVMPLIAAPIASAWGWRSPFLIAAVPTMIFGVVIFILIGKYNQRIAAQKAIREVEVPVQTGPTDVRWGELIPFVALTVLTGTLLMSSASYLSLYAVDYLGISESSAAMLMSVQPAVGALAAPLGGYLADRFGNLKVMMCISVLAVPLIYSLGMASNVATFILVMVFIGLVSTARMPTSESYIFANAPLRYRATVLGVYYFSGTGVSGVLTPFIGNLIDRYKFQFTYTVTSIAAAVVVVVCSLFIWINRRRKSTDITL
jgi:MFS family permease